MEAEAPQVTKKDDAGVHALPVAIFRAKCIRVLRGNLFNADINLHFGSQVRRRIVVAGFELVGLDAPERQAAAAHCLIALIGSRGLIIHPEDPDRFDGQIVASVYLDVYPGHATPDGTRLAPPHMNDALVDVGRAMQWAQAHNFDHRALRGAFKEG